ncbi:MAG TPA: hypothetical protein VII35_14985 [Steroidobacteraceae bacterium]
MTREVVEPLTTSCASSTTGVQTDYTLDAFGNRTVAAVSGTGITTRSSSATYDSVGRFVATTTDAGGFVQTYTSDNRFGGLHAIDFPDRKFGVISYIRIRKTFG